LKSDPYLQSVFSFVAVGLFATLLTFRTTFLLNLPQGCTCWGRRPEVSPTRPRVAVFPTEFFELLPLYLFFLLQLVMPLGTPKVSEVFAFFLDEKALMLRQHLPSSLPKKYFLSSTRMMCDQRDVFLSQYWVRPRRGRYAQQVFPLSTSVRSFVVGTCLYDTCPLLYSL